jgi:hypothetical protein
LRKRKNKTICETINAIMHDQNLSMISWVEACMTKYMFRTRIFTRIEAFTRVKLEIEHFRLFECSMYLHVPKEKKSKLDPLERKDIVNLQRHSRSTSLVRDRSRQAETLPLKEKMILQNLRWRLTVKPYLLPLQQFRGRKTLFQLIQLLQLICSVILQQGIKRLPRLTMQEAKKHTSLSRHPPRK